MGCFITFYCIFTSKSVSKKNFENRSTFGKVSGKNIVAPFFRTRCRSALRMEQNIKPVPNHCPCPSDERANREPIHALSRLVMAAL